MRISLIVAISRNGVIGRDGDLPWRLPADLARFKRLTMGHPVLMGRKTYESIGRPLPGRTNIVLSRKPDFEAAGCLSCTDLESGLRAAEEEGTGECFVMGGAGVYEATLPRASRIFLTRVQADIEGDVSLSSLREAEWRETSREEHPADERHAHSFTWIDLVRRED